MWTDVYVYKMGTNWNPYPNTAETGRPHYDRPTACVIAQQYSSATFVSLRFQYRKEKIRALFKNIFSVFYFIKNVRMSETAHNEIACHGLSVNELQFS